MKGTVLGAFCLTSLLYAVACVPSARAYQSYDDGAGNGCVQCHPGFQGGQQNLLHFVHNIQLAVTECNLCHPSGAGSKPVNTYWSGPGGGLGCAGCHGRDYGEISPNSGLAKASAYGLRQHHANNGVTSCQGCHQPGQLGHSNPLPPILPENVAPPNYGLFTNNLTDPCFSDQEDTTFDVDAVGLDNDGDGAADWPADSDCLMPTTTTTTTTTTTLPLACGAAPAIGCEDPAKGILLVNEKKAGKEKLKVVFKKLKSAVAQAQFGDPISSPTSYAICVYDDADALRGEFLVDRAWQLCGTPPKPCWAAISNKGYKYADKDASADGILKMIMRGGDAGKGSIVIIGKNNSSKGQTSLPTGVASPLLDNSHATVQVLTSDASCFGIATSNVKKANGSVFKAIGLQ